MGIWRCKFLHSRGDVNPVILRFTDSNTKELTMKKLSLAAMATAALLSTGFAAGAADLPPAAPAPYRAPVLVPAFSWTGFYLGANIGAGWLQGDVTSNFGA